MAVRFTPDQFVVKLSERRSCSRQRSSGIGCLRRSMKPVDPFPFAGPGGVIVNVAFCKPTRRESGRERFRDAGRCVSSQRRAFANGPSRLCGNAME